MPKRRRTEAAKKGWKKQNSKACGRNDKKHKLWNGFGNDCSMVEAMEAVKSGRLGVNRAAKEYNVPRTTLKDRIAGSVKHSSKSGPDPYLTLRLSKETEFLINVCKMECGKTKKEVVDIVRRTVKKKKEKEGKDLGTFDVEGWWKGFI